MKVFAQITGIEYKPLLCKSLVNYPFDKLNEALEKDSTFTLDVDAKNKLAVSWWVSAKRTRSYPYARVYDSLDFSGKKVTIIPIMKDEGREGDRDFLQWDTVSLMSLLGVYVIISYYDNAKISNRYKHKITEQRFDLNHVKSEIKKLLSYQSDALHWNLEQVENAGTLAKKAVENYSRISKQTGVEMHSLSSAEKRIAQLVKGKDIFMKLSRELAQKAQARESVTIQPKEKVDGTKAILTIKNYLGGYYYFTSDELLLNKDTVYLIEAKNTRENKLPSVGDIKDGLIKMILFRNLKEVLIDSKKYKVLPILKLTTGNGFKLDNLDKNSKEMLEKLKIESVKNGFSVKINGEEIK